MRKFMFLLLLAGAAAPAPAADRSGERRSVFREPREDSDKASSERPRREAPVARAPRSDDDGPRRAQGGNHVDLPRADRPERAERPERAAAGDTVRNWRQGSDSSSFEQRARKVGEGRATFPHRPVSEQVNLGGDGDSVRNWRRRDRDTDTEQGRLGRTIEERNLRTAPNVREGGLVQTRRSTPGVFVPGERRVSRTPVWGTEPPAPRTARELRAQPSRRWSGEWRHDRRYDWRDWRRRHHDRFRFAFYYDPFGWDYLRYGVGWRMWPRYYRSSYWLNDPWQYRLPPAYGPYRWIRYHNDALLVNIYTGEVVDVEYDFFW